MAGLKGTETEKNLLKAFAGESQARNRYTYFASKAKKGIFKFLIFLLKRLIRKRKTQKDFLNFWKAENWK